MSAWHLTRTDPHHNMARFYRLDVQPDLFGGWVLWREWGRIGQGGTVRHESFADQQAAEDAQRRMTQAKTRRGYCLAQRQ
jgi:predicted DNA-binding WGR domain protein